MQDQYSVTLDYLAWRVKEAGWMIPTRIIENYEIVFVINGVMKVCIEGVNSDIQAGMLVCFYPGISHSILVPEGNSAEFFGMHFTPHESMELPLPEISTMRSQHRLVQLFRALYEVYQQKPYLYQWKQNLLCEQILCEVFTQLHKEESSAEFLRIGRVLEYIHADPCRHFEQEELQELAGMKKTMFFGAFRHVTGMSPVQYILSLRLERARTLLIGTELPVGEVARQCGFEDAYYFSRCFHQHYGMSPRRYRNENPAL